jgi:hypothetical protein
MHSTTVNYYLARGLPGLFYADFFLPNATPAVLLASMAGSFLVFVGLGIDLNVLESDAAVIVYGTYAFARWGFGQSRSQAAAWALGIGLVAVLWYENAWKANGGIGGMGATPSLPLDHSNPHGETNLCGTQNTLSKRPFPWPGQGFPGPLFAGSFGATDWSYSWN